MKLFLISLLLIASGCSSLSNKHEVAGIPDEGLFISSGDLTPNEQLEYKNAQLNKEIKYLKSIIQNLKANQIVKDDSGSQPGYRKVGDYYRQYNQKELDDKQYNNRKSITINNTSVDVVMRFNSKSVRKQWWNKLSKAGINDKFQTRSNSEYLIYLGHFDNYTKAQNRVKLIKKKSGASFVEIVNTPKNI